MYSIKFKILRRIIAPMGANRDLPSHAARGSAFGLFISFTPTVGIQMPFVFILWVLTRWFKKEWDFSLPIAIAWTWVSNVATMVPLYYLFLVTGRVMLGRWDELRSFQVFENKLTKSLVDDAGPSQTVWVYMLNLIEQFGVPIWIGSLPWAILASWIGYSWTLRLVNRISEQRKLRLKSTSGKV